MLLLEVDVEVEVAGGRLVGDRFADLSVAAGLLAVVGMVLQDMVDIVVPSFVVPVFVFVLQTCLAVVGHRTVVAVVAAGLRTFLWAVVVVVVVVL